LEVVSLKVRVASENTRDKRTTLTSAKRQNRTEQNPASVFPALSTATSDLNYTDCVLKSNVTWKGVVSWDSN
jgi:hypothetical protein